MSLLCASLTWLRDEQDRVKRAKTTPENGATGESMWSALLDFAPNPQTDDWVLAQTLERKRRELEAEELEHAERLAKARQREAAMRKAARARVRKRLVGPFTAV